MVCGVGLRGDRDEKHCCCSLLDENGEQWESMSMKRALTMGLGCRPVMLESLNGVDLLDPATEPSDAQLSALMRDVQRDAARKAEFALNKLLSSLRGERQQATSEVQDEGNAPGVAR